MIYIYTRTGCNSSNKAIKWFQAFKIPHQKCSISQMTEHEFFHLLSLTERGLEELLVQRKIIGKQGEINISEWRVRDVFFLMHKDPRFFKSPIIVSENKLVIGWNPENIRLFLSKNYRQVKRNLNR